MRTIKLFTILYLLTAICYLRSQPVQQEWVARYDSPYHLDDISESMVIDRLGNIYVTGFSFINAGWKQIVIIKYNPSGVQQWVKIYADTTLPEHNPIYIKLDTGGNI